MAGKARRSDPGWSKHFCQECTHKLLAGFGCEHVVRDTVYRAHRMCCKVCPPLEVEERSRTRQNRRR